MLNLEDKLAREFFYFCLLDSFNGMKLKNINAETRVHLLTFVRFSVKQLVYLGILSERCLVLIRNNLTKLFSRTISSKC